MKTILGLLLIVAGIALGLYVGLYLCFIGGITSIVQAVRMPEGAEIAGPIAWGVVRIIFAGFLGMLSGFLLFIPGTVMLKK